ncbi:hypothetical protein ACFLYE_04435 [Chloroflexota bacterium]
MHFSPEEKVYKPGPYDARFSLPYLLACLLVDGHVGVKSFTEEKVQNPKTDDFCIKGDNIRRSSHACQV